MTRNNNRFANRETTVKGYVINLEAQTQTPFEVKTQYTRSNEKAVAYAREALRLENDPKLIVAVTELENDKPKPIKYDDGEIYERAFSHYSNEIEAQNDAIKYNATIRKIEWYLIDGQIWFTDDNGEYATEYYTAETPVNMTKTEMRSYLITSFKEANDGYTVIGVHNVAKQPIGLYCVIDENELAECIES